MRPTELTLVEVADAIRARSLSSREVVEACLAGIQAWQPSINAFTTVLADSARDLTIQTALLEARLLIGSDKLFRDFSTAITRSPSRPRLL